MNITLTGNLGSGKSSVCKELAALGWNIVSAGDIFRGIAKDRGLTVEELNEIAKTDKSIDKNIDDRSIRLGRELDHTVFDSRLAWHFVEKSYKVFLLVDTLEAAIRVFSGTSRDAEDYGSLPDAQKGLKRRANLERSRFLDIYGIDYYDRKNYDLIIESTYATPQEIAVRIDACLKQFENSDDNGSASERLMLNTRGLIPTLSVDELESDTADIRIASYGGHSYILSGHQKIYEALKNNDPFFECDGLIKAENDLAIKINELSDDALVAYADACGFKYKNLPSEKVVREDYLMNIYI